MAATFTHIRASLSLGASLTQNNGGATVNGSGSLALDQAFTAGTAAEQADQYLQSTEQDLADAATLTLDLYDAANWTPPNDPLGNAVALVELVALVIRNHADSEGALLVGGDGTAAAFTSIFNGSASAVLTLPPNSALCFLCPAAAAWAIADGTNHLLKLAASGGDVVFSIAALGRTA